MLSGLKWRVTDLQKPLCSSLYGAPHSVSHLYLSIRRLMIILCLPRLLNLLHPVTALLWHVYSSQTHAKVMMNDSTLVHIYACLFWISGQVHRGAWVPELAPVLLTGAHSQPRVAPSLQPSNLVKSGSRIWARPTSYREGTVNEARRWSADNPSWLLINFVIDNQSA